MESAQHVFYRDLNTEPLPRRFYDVTTRRATDVIVVVSDYYVTVTMSPVKTAGALVCIPPGAAVCN